MEFKDKIVIIKGAARGIGVACAWAFAGGAPILSSLTLMDEGAEKVASEIRRQGLKVVYLNIVIK